MKTFFYVGLLFCLVAVTDLTLWIIISAKDVSFDQAVLGV